MCTGRTRRGAAGDGDGGGRRGWGRGVLHVNLAGGLCLLALCGTARAGLLSDDVPFHITWPGHELTLPTSGALYRDEDYIIMTTQGNERYKCMLPTVERADQDDEEMGKAPDPDVLLDPLFKQNSCSYRLLHRKSIRQVELWAMNEIIINTIKPWIIEPYWTYEVCHGRHVRQYHEEKEFGQRVTVQEYYLGYIAKHDPELKKNTETRSKHEYTSTKNNNIPMKNIDGQMTAYYPVEMGDGTTCGLRGGVPRRASVLYVCHPNARHEVLSVAEVTSCEYEVVVLTPLLCRHPKYKFKTTPINDIYCKSFPGSPVRPQSLDRMEQEQKESSLPRDTFQWTRQAVQEKSSPSDLAMKAAEQAHKPRATAQVGGQRTMTLISSVTDEQLLRAFLAGSHCFHGGVGWWKYELCYGRHVHQYHEEKDGTRTVIVVGTWNKEEHEVWAKGSTPRAYQRAADGTLKIKSVSHFYGHGDVCDINGKPRQVIVKLKVNPAVTKASNQIRTTFTGRCKESDSPHAVTVYMLEPHSCQYILGVESSLMCRILDSADDAGQLSLPP